MSNLKNYFRMRVSNEVENVTIISSIVYETAPNVLLGQTNKQCQLWVFFLPMNHINHMKIQLPEPIILNRKSYYFRSIIFILESTVTHRFQSHCLLGIFINIKHFQ